MPELLYDLLWVVFTHLPQLSTLYISYKYREKSSHIHIDLPAGNVVSLELTRSMELRKVLDFEVLLKVNR